jgi:HAE1 family hydrophobic/amphiphilic exporter-1
MSLSDLSIDRPVLTWMMILALIVFGILGYNRLGVDQYPNMEFPVLTVSATLEGATPEGIEEDVTDVLEEHLNTVAGVRNLESTSYRGAAVITVEFDLGTNLDIAAQNVRDQVAQARRELPVDLEPPIVGTFDPNDQPILWIPLNISTTATEASEFVKRRIIPYLESIPGVAGIVLFGEMDRNVRIWLHGDALRARALSAVDVLHALRREHVELPAGAIEGDRIQYAVRTDAEFHTIEELEGMVVATIDGAPIYLRDVARLEDGSEDIESIMRYNGEISVGLGIRKRSGGNTVAIVDEVLSRLEDLKEILPPEIKVEDQEGFIDFSKGIREAVEETKFALLFGALLAIFTVFFFLRRSRPTMIVALAIPVSLVSTFGLVWIFGFTLNTMTLLGMTLAVGVVIDDAIVVLENIERHRANGKNSIEAAKVGTREIAFAATSATISVAAVFLPVFFVDGLVGSFLGEFGLVVAGSVLISLFVALTLTPMLAARMPPPKPRQAGSIYERLEDGFKSLESSYQRVLNFSLDHRMKTVGVTFVSLALAALFASQLKTEFFPPSDEGIFFARMEAAPGSSIWATLDYLEEDEKWFLDQPEILGIFSAAGSSGSFEPPRTNAAMIFGTLALRKDRDKSVLTLIKEARSALSPIPGRAIRIFNPADSLSLGDGGFRIQLRGYLSLEELDRISQDFSERLYAHGGFVDLDTSLKLGLPELKIHVDREKAAEMGVDARTIGEAIQLMVGGLDVGVFKESGRRYDIRMRLEEDLRDDVDSIGSLYVRNRDGDVISLRNLVTIEKGAAAASITRTNRQRSVTIRANLDGLKLGGAMDYAREVAAESLPPTVTLHAVGDAESMSEGNIQFAVAMMLGILVIYMVLAAQFESLLHPITVMLSLPLSMVGALGGLLLFGHSLNLFSLIGIILLFGLVTKNSILLVDYANQLRKTGLDKVEAMRRAAPIRMRPILMTAISMIFGVLPAALGLGPGSETRAPMAIATAMGMLSSTMLTLLFVPVFYILIDDLGDFVKRQVRRLFGGGEGIAEPAAAPNQQ